MSSAYTGEVRLVGFNFAPAGWLQCMGQSVAIAEYSTLFNLIGTTYGGNGTSVFNLPDLRGRIPIHQGSNGVTNYALGQPGGAENVTVTVNQYPGHSHAFSSSTSGGGTGSPVGNVAGSVPAVYAATPPAASMNAATLRPSPGSNQPHANLQPFLVLNWIICVYGIYPSQS